MSENPLFPGWFWSRVLCIKFGACALLKVYFRKGKVLQDAGFLGDALQLFLQCLALDEDFAPAKLQVEKVMQYACQSSV